MDKTGKKLAGWEREFWKLLSPETARLPKAELNRPAAVAPKPRGPIDAPPIADDNCALED